MSMPVEMIMGDVETLAESGFYWRDRGGVTVLVCGPLEEAGFTNGFSTRFGGVSDFPNNSLNLAGFDEDRSENIFENRRRFLSAFDGNHRLATSWQVHGDGIRTVASMEGADESEDRADGLVSGMPGVLVGVKTADCVPVLLGDERTGAYAAVHAGWRGTVKSIVVRGVEALQREFGSDPADITAAIGPASCSKDYEIGRDVIDEFHSAFEGAGKYFTPTRDGHALVDLHLANKDQLISCGVPFGRIFTAPLCTMERVDLFFSYRKEKKLYGKTGRLLSVVGRSN